MFIHRFINIYIYIYIYINVIYYNYIHMLYGMIILLTKENNILLPLGHMFDLKKLVKIKKF